MNIIDIIWLINAKSAAHAIGFFTCLTCLCFPKIYFIDNLFLNKVQNRRKTYFLQPKDLWGTVKEFHKMTTIGMLEGGMTVNDVAVSFDVHHTTTWGLAQRCRTTGTAKDMPTSARPKRLTAREECYIRITAGCDRFLPATRIVDRVRRATGVCTSAQAVRNKLKACRFKSRRPHKGMELTVHHKIQRHAWTNQQLHRNWKTVLFSDESQFTLKFADGRIRVWRRPGERFAAACVMPVDRFGGS